MLYKKGFSLGEVLLTVGVIGTLAMLLLPIMKNSLPSKNKIMFRKAHFSLEKAIGVMLQDQNAYPDDVVGNSTEYNNRIPLQLNYTTATGNGSANKFCYYLTKQLNLESGANCPTTTGITKIGTTIDGMDWYLYLPAIDTSPNSEFPTSSTSYATKIIVDVDGAGGHNCFTDTQYSTYKPSNSYTACTDNKPDTFIMGVRYDGKIQIGSGYDSNAKASYDATAENILINPKSNEK